MLSRRPETQVVRRTVRHASQMSMSSWREVSVASWSHVNCSLEGAIAADRRIVECGQRARTGAEKRRRRKIMPLRKSRYCCSIMGFFYRTVLNQLSNE
jgi:hypothetical protein